MTSIADKALLLRIQNKDNNIRDLVDAAVRAYEVSDYILDNLDQRIANEFYEHIYWVNLLPYFQKHKRPALFKSLYERIKPGGFDVAQLFNIGYAENGLEDQLCKMLYDAFNEKGSGVYTHLFEALSVHGGPNSLEMMEVIRHELIPAIKVNKIFSDSLREGFSEEKGLSTGEMETLIQNKFLNDFSEKLSSAIQLLRLKGIKLPDESARNELDEGQALLGRRDRIDYYMAKANILLPDHPPEALTNMRKAAEAISKDILDSTFNKPKNGKTKPGKSFSSLEDMINGIRMGGLVPVSIEKCLGTLQTFGNLASHDQEESPENISAEMAESTFGHLKTVVE